MTETSVIVEAIKQAPSLAIICVIVWLFLSRLNVLVDALKELHREHLDARTLSREAIKDNTEAMKENTQAMTRLIEGFESRWKTL